MLNANYEAEQSVIGIIMMDGKEAMQKVALKLNESDFHVTEFKSIYAACNKLFRIGKPIDAVTVTTLIGEEYSKTILSAAQSTPTISNLNAYVDAVKDRAQKINAYNQASDFLRILEDEKPDAEECQSIVSGIAKCFNEKSVQGAVNAEEGFMNFLAQQDKPKEYITTGFSLLDRFLYVERGDFVIVGGRPSAGKTAFTLQMLLHMSEKYKVGYFSLETKPAKIFDRIISNYAWTSFSKIKTNTLTDEDWRGITSCYDTFHQLNFEIVPAAGWSTEQIKSYSEIAGFDIIFIDYMQLIKSQGKDRVEKVTNISIDLHTMAQQSGISVVALSQLSRGGDGDADLTSLRDSGQIEQDADAVLFLNYDPDNPDERNLRIAKNKEGKIGRIQANFDGDHQRFSLLETKYSE